MTESTALEADDCKDCTDKSCDGACPLCGSMKVAEWHRSCWPGDGDAGIDPEVTADMVAGSIGTAGAFDDLCAGSATTARRIIAGLASCGRYGDADDIEDAWLASAAA